MKQIFRKAASCLMLAACTLHLSGQDILRISTESTDLVLREARHMGMYRFVVEFTEAAHRELHLSFWGMEKWLKDSQGKYAQLLIERLEESGDIATANAAISSMNFLQRMYFLKKVIERKSFWPQLFWRTCSKIIYTGIKKRMIRCTMFWKRKS